jgi:SAM-dependent methyltransferase
MAQFRALDRDAIRKDIHHTIGANYNHASRAGMRTTQNGTKLAEEFQRIRRSLSQIAELSKRIGEQPPAPPTLRARLGAHLVQIVRRALFWYAPQITLVQIATSNALADQLQILEQMKSEAERTEGVVLELVQGARESLASTKAVESQVARVESRIEAMGSQLRSSLEQLEIGELARLQQETLQLRAAAQRVRQDLFQMGIQISGQARRISILIEEVRKQIPGPAVGTALVQPADYYEKHALDTLYVHFEDEFRGSREEILGRLEVYLPLLKSGSHGTPEAPILDLGCGRGEWLQLLKRNEITAHGVDSNSHMVALCNHLGLDVTERDVLDYLRDLPDESVGAVTAFHILEHLPLDEIVKVLDESRRILRRGGVAIYETPNPENLQVGAHTFYTDLTHRNPLPSSTLRFLVEARGLSRPEVWHLNPYPAAFRVPEVTELDKRFNQMFYGPRDYAVIGYKM